MNSLLISALIGIVAGVIDIIPMIIQKLGKRAIASAFLQYFFVSIIIVNIDLPGIFWWVQGGVVSLAMALPIIIIISGKDKKVIPIIASMAVVLGTLISFAGHYFK